MNGKVLVLIFGFFFLWCLGTLVDGAWNFLNHDELRLVDVVNIILGGFGTPFQLWALRRQIKINKSE